jgi:hypothetical protein
MAVVVLIVIAFVLATAACTSTTDESGAAVTDGERLSPSLYPAAMGDICAESNIQLAELPAPTDETTRANWVDDVAGILLAESAAFAEISVDGELGADHRAFVANTQEQAEQWAAVATALRTDSPDDLAAASEEIAALTLGRNDLATEMGLSGCEERQIDA